MKITVYSAKGSAGKTPIATNIALDREYALGTNELFHVFDGFIPEERLLAIEPQEAFPKLPDEIDIVFDLAGSISNHSTSIISAIEQSDLVIVPIYNEVKSLNAGINTIGQVLEHNKNILVVATKLQKQKGEVFRDWGESRDLKNIEQQIRANIAVAIPVLPLKFSKVFDSIFERESSISQIRKGDPLSGYTFREIAQQFDAIYNFIDKHYAKQKQSNKLQTA